MTALFFATFLLLIALELIKGLSANGTPPVLQRFSWQMGAVGEKFRDLVVPRTPNIGDTLLCLGF